MQTFANLKRAASIALLALASGTAQEQAPEIQTYRPEIGRLRVYDFDREKYDGSVVRTLFGAYHVYDASGTHVANIEESWVEPRTVRLREGKYLVRGKRKSNELAEFYVLIEGGKTTEVFSAGLSWNPANTSPPNRSSPPLRR